MHAGAATGPQARLGSHFEVSEREAPRLEEPSKSPVGAKGAVLPAVVILPPNRVKKATALSGRQPSAV